jgi:hypothetical protein
MLGVRQGAFTYQFTINNYELIDLTRYWLLAKIQLKCTKSFILGRRFETFWLLFKEKTKKLFTKFIIAKYAIKLSHLLFVIVLYSNSQEAVLFALLYIFSTPSTIKFYKSQGRREGGRGGNFYRGPGLKRGPKRAKFTFFKSYSKILPGPRVKSTFFSTALTNRQLKKNYSKL